MEWIASLAVTAMAFWSGWLTHEVVTTIKEEEEEE